VRLFSTQAITLTLSTTISLSSDFVRSYNFRLTYYQPACPPISLPTTTTDRQLLVVGEPLAVGGSPLQMHLWHCLQQQRYHGKDAVRSRSWKGFLSGRLWRTTGDIGRFSLHPYWGRFLGPGVRPGFCAGSLQQSHQSALVDPGQDEWSNLCKIILFL